MTVTEMAKLIGNRVYIPVGNGLYAEVHIVDVTQAWGKTRYKVQDVLGNFATVEYYRGELHA